MHNLTNLLLNQFYVLATISPSLDHQHPNNNIPKFFISTYYSESDPTSKLKNKVKNLFIIRIVKDSKANSEKLQNIKSVDLNSNLELTISLEILIAEKSLLKDLILKRYLKKKSYSKVLFVFENLEWTNIRIIFRSLSLIVSGGNISTRYKLSSSDFFLSKILEKMDLGLLSVYKSWQIEKENIRNSFFKESTLYSEITYLFAASLMLEFFLIDFELINKYIEIEKNILASLNQILNSGKKPELSPVFKSFSIDSYIKFKKIPRPYYEKSVHKHIAVNESNLRSLIKKNDLVSLIKFFEDSLNITKMMYNDSIKTRKEMDMASMNSIIFFFNQKFFNSRLLENIQEFPLNEKMYKDQINSFFCGFLQEHLNAVEQLKKKR